MIVEIREAMEHMQLSDDLEAIKRVGATGGRRPVLTVIVAGSGPATPGGPLTLDGTHCLDPGDSETPDSFPRVSEGEFVFTFASGATLTGRYGGNLVLRETGLYNIQAELWFTGGTGQFAYPGDNGGGVSIEQVSPAPTLDRQTGEGTNVRFRGIYHP